MGPGLAAEAEVWRTKFLLDPPDRFSQLCLDVTLSDTVSLSAWNPKGRDDIQRNTWFITRCCPSSAQMWAGKVLKIGRLRSPRLDAERIPQYDIVLEVEWHAPCLDDDDEVLIDRDINVPLVQKQRANVHTRYYLAEDIAPVMVHVLPHPQFQDTLCVLSRSFSFMRVAGWNALRPVLPVFRQ